MEPEKSPSAAVQKTIEDVLEEIDSNYFDSITFDPCIHELKKLPDVLDIHSIQARRENLRQQHMVVSKRVLQLILQKQSQRHDEVARILEIQQQLQAALRLCREGRTSLSGAKSQFTTTSLGILANYRKKQTLRGLLHSLNTIKTLLCTEERLQELLNEANYARAISLLLECQRAACTYRHFNCVAALSGKLQDTLEMAEEQLDGALTKVCAKFQPEFYNNVMTAYQLLGKTQMAMDQLHMHFYSAIHNKAVEVIRECVDNTESLVTGGASSSLKPFRLLCQNVVPEKFIDCLLNLCKSLWEVILNYNQMRMWHKQNACQQLHKGGVSTVIDFELSCDQKYVEQKLEKGMFRMWHDVQSRVGAYLMGCDLARFKFEEFLQILSVVHRLMEVGEEFCGSKSEELQNSIREQSTNYFKSYHRERLEELRLFLENENWELCPVKNNFTILQLQEFKSLRNALKGIKFDEGSSLNLTSHTASPDCSTSSAHSQDSSSTAGGYFLRYSESGSPFDIIPVESQEEDILANIRDGMSVDYSDESDDDVPEDVKKDFVDEGGGDNNKNPKPFVRKQVQHDFLKVPVLTTTTLTVLRYCGKYLQMSQLLRRIASDVIAGMIQLFEYYMYAVFVFFTADLQGPENYTFSLRLQATLKHIEGSLILLDRSDSEIQSQKNKIARPYMSPDIDLSQSQRLYGLPKRIIAVESLVHLAKQLESLKPYVEQLLEQTCKTEPYFQQFYTQTISAAVDLRRPVYMCVSQRIVDFGRMLHLMSKVNWEVKDVMSQHSDYVDALMMELKTFFSQLESVAAIVPLSPEVNKVLWSNLIELICNTFVEGFSNAKKCSNGGRALMQLDFTQFLTQLDKLVMIRPIPNKEYVEMYVKAYYLQEPALEKWIKEHNEYSSKHLLALVSCTCQNRKKSRLRLSSLIEELGR
ncbi:syndetin [Schistocerca americana]|uniref:syndetin n=1 Tax=Schistocerca americana TaxID=7009 RepID=UPI001F4FC222|nr:syndetin [Schistocerca americana]XP_046985078.1 syndetin [Schistocerca americana]XP_046985079.1 syndetin [Schistocerca americana]XP_046985080.1 syndetin [Schistocerca americana]XP_046985081.1 syndetin [Schistocerca americana]XP_046985082.1 syndetin [Schistocerca americana]XP_046985083.1 syndetin [Schistocerca americana]XP_047102429.1 syndetin [Schistocerca piceifrons]XP_047102430.1 syndetin [Schistocerca piceifrons]XP_047102431.1 syndetin [Schistocerca piceifrons]XP_047102432.1 syndeti